MAPPMSVMDPNSYSESEKCVVTSLDWDVRIDFEAKAIGGYAHLNIEKKVANLETLVLDVRDLKIEKITVAGTGRECEFDISNPLNVSFGSKLTIKLGAIEEQRFIVSIKYVTSPDASALQWLRAEQTAGKRKPYLFSQCQAIHARSLFPCQDSPAVKFPYTAKVRAPVGITVLMSAERSGVELDPNNSNEQISKFTMTVPIPSYLVAIVAGDLESRDIGPRSKVWSEREFVDAAAHEFSETETMLSTAEHLMGPYVWRIYDLLVLPPSFPYGGMENPCLTFVTPTLLAGDKSLADVIAHEISHSWTGNLVSNRTFEDFWLNEGHTMYVERKILGEMHGEPHRQLHAYEGWKTLQTTVKSLKKAGEEPYTRLVPDLRGVDPDDAFSSVPYEKGFALLYYLETLLGGPAVFQRFLKAYIEHFKYQSISTQDWKDFLYSYFTSKEDQRKLDSVEWDEWMRGLGLPPYTPNYDTSLAVPSRELVRRWKEQPDDQLDVFSPSDISSMPSFLVKDMVAELASAQPPLSLTKVRKMQQVYNLNEVRNSEIRMKWLQLCIKARWDESIPHALKFLNEQGRMKFARPLYRDLYDWEAARPMAIENFKAHEAEMHNTTGMLVAKDLKLRN